MKKHKLNIDHEMIKFLREMLLANGIKVPTEQELLKELAIYGSGYITMDETPEGEIILRHNSLDNVIKGITGNQITRIITDDVLDDNKYHVQHDDEIWNKDGCVHLASSPESAQRICDTLNYMLADLYPEPLAYKDEVPALEPKQKDKRDPRQWVNMKQHIRSLNKNQRKK